MAQIAKQEVQTEIKSCPDKFYDIFRNKQYLMPKICPNYVKDIRVLHGNWQSLGSVKLWTYVAGNSETVKETIDSIDEQNMSITYNISEAEILNYYKSYKPTLRVMRNGNNGGIVKWMVEYEKQNESIPDPYKYLEFLDILNKSVDAYLLNA